ncbi:MAG: hypothetical protein DKINENOH_03952 [bacterium]|nr:hypothetical protein [bacterium]
MLLLILAVLFTLAPASAEAQARKLVRVHLADRSQAEELLSYDLDFASHAIQRHADVVVTAAEERLLQKKGFKLQSLIDDLASAFAERFGSTPDMGAYHTYQEMYDEMLATSQNYPNITKLMSLGSSIEGRQIWAMKVSDNPALEEDEEPALLYMANMHAREVVTPEIILFFLKHLTQNYGVDAQITDFVDHREFWLIPTQNPDGHVHVENVDAWWRKNRRNNGNGSFGVDQNRNFGYMWGFDNVGSSPNPFSETYRGTGPFSEPETQAIRALCQQQNFVLALSFHSYGNLWLFPWGYVPQNTSHHEIFVELASHCVAFNGYTPGNPASGTIYLTNGDTDDYFYGETSEKNRVFSFTPEVGEEFWPPESQIPILTQENLGPMLYLAEVAPIVADNPWRLLRPATPVIAPFTGIEDGEYAVSWTIADDPNNPAVVFQLDELSGYSTLTDNAESGPANFTPAGFNVSTARYHSNSHSFYSGMGDGKNVNMTTAVPLLVPAGGTLTFWAWYSIELHWDYAYVEVSTDGMTFQSIPGNITTNSNPNGMNLGNGITGSSGGWIQGIFNLNAFAGQNIYVRFRYVTDSAVMQEGFYVDDITPVPRFASITTLADDIAGNAYEISGQQSGVYFYRVRAQDAEQQWGGRSALEDVTVEEQVPVDFLACLEGGQETPPVITNAAGGGMFTLNAAQDALTFTIRVSSLSGPITAAHFHNAAAGVAGPVVRNITFVGEVASGSWLSTDAQPLTPALVAELLAGRIYVNVHTAANPGGEIRGQLVTGVPIDLFAALNGSQEVPPVQTPATGAGVFTLSGDGDSLTFDVTVSDLSSAITAAHFHNAAAGVNGPVVRNITFVGNHATGVWAETDPQALTPALVAELLAGRIYANVHTTVNPGGEIRGQLGKEPPPVCVTYDFPIATGAWYLISLPVIPPDAALGTLFPGAAAAFEWDYASQNYVSVTQLEPEKGYWLLMAQAATVEVCGEALNSYAKSYSQPGWDMIGSVMTASPVLDNPEGALLSMFRWDALAQNYIPVDPPSIAPEQGCWILMWQAPSAITVGSGMASDEGQGAKMSAGEEQKAIYTKYGALPPPPPFAVTRDRLAVMRPAEFGLSQNYPNPFNPETMIEFQLPQAGRVSLKIYSLLGHEIRTLIEEEMPAGFHRVKWDGSDGAGQKLNSGVYLYRLRAGEFLQTRKLVLLQ